MSGFYVIIEKIYNFLVLKRNKIIFFSVLAFILVFGLGVLLSKNYFRDDSGKCDANKYHNINPDLICQASPKVIKKNYVEFKGELNKVIADKAQAGDITVASVYFRDLQNGPTFGIDEYRSFSPASLLKLPLFLTYLNLAEDNPDLLKTTVGFKETDFSNEQYYPAKFSADPSKVYTIEELLNYMIKYSDNRSYYILREYTKEIAPGHDVIKETFIDLGIIDPKDALDQTINVKSYAAIFAQLYHLSYLNNKDSSEYALEVLSDTDFDNGLVLGLPDDIKVAHKFGERFNGKDDVKQLHDCGIVYYPENPYLICVMTQGKSFDKLSETIGLISKMVYEEFDSRSIKE